jgi:hypothetical protein
LKERRDYSGDLDVDGRIILKWILNKIRGCELYSFDFGQKAVAGSYEHGKKLLGCMKWSISTS